MNGGRSAAQSRGRWGAQAQEQPGRPRPQQPLANQPGPRDPPPSPTKTSANERGPAPLGAHRCSHIIVQIKFFGALNFFFKAPAAFAAAAGDSGRFPAPPLPVPPPGAGAAVWARVSPPPAGRAWCWAPGPPRLSRGAQVSSARPRGWRGAAAGLQEVRLPRRRCTGWAEGRAAPGLLQAAPLLTAGRRAGAQAAGCGAGRREWEGPGPGPGRWLGSRGRPHRAPTCAGRTHGLARARAAGRIVQKETEGRAQPKVTSPTWPEGAGLGRRRPDS